MGSRSASRLLPAGMLEFPHRNLEEYAAKAQFFLNSIPASSSSRFVLVRCRPRHRARKPRPAFWRLLPRRRMRSTASRFSCCSLPAPSSPWSRGLLVFVDLQVSRARESDEQHEPAQIYGSTQVELAWTVIPVLIVVVLFLTTARIIFAIQDAPKPQVGARRDRGRASVLVGVPLSEAGHRDRQRAARSGEHAAGTRSRPFCTCSRRMWITASGCRSWRARRI